MTYFVFMQEGITRTGAAHGSKVGNFAQQENGDSESSEMRHNHPIAINSLKGVSSSSSEDEKVDGEEKEEEEEDEKEELVEEEEGEDEKEEEGEEEEGGGLLEESRTETAGLSRFIFWDNLLLRLGTTGNEFK